MIIKYNMIYINFDNNQIINKYKHITAYFNAKCTNRKMNINKFQNLDSSS